MPPTLYTSRDVLQRVRADITSTAAFEQTTISTNLSLDRGYIWLIHKILWWINGAWDDAAQGTSEFVSLQLTRESKAAAITSLNEADLIAMVRLAVDRYATIGTDAGPLWWVRTLPLVSDFRIPLPFAGNTLYFATANNASGSLIYSVEIEFTLQKVREKDYFAVASSLLLT